MPRRVDPKVCGCGCNGMTKGGEFIPGHDSKLMRAILLEVGGVLALRKFIEQRLGKTITANLDE